LGIAIRADPDFAHRIEGQMSPIIHLFTPIFFVSVGLSLNLREIDWSSTFIWTFSLSVFALAMLGKLIGGLVSGEKGLRALIVGLAMSPRGEVGLIFAELGRTSGIMNAELYAATVIVIVFTTFLPPLVIKGLYRRYGQVLDAPP
jgi:Kef-type K+ transport system membrane component KefB